MPSSRSLIRRVPSIDRLRPDAQRPQKPKESDDPKRTWLTPEELARFDKVHSQITTFRMMMCASCTCRRDIPKDDRIIYCSHECAEPRKEKEENDEQ